MNSKANDRSWCPIAGNTFRVPIRSQGTQGVRGKCREDSSVGGSKRPRMEVDGSCSSDTASSSSSSGKKRKENKKVKRDEEDKHNELKRAKKAKEAAKTAEVDARKAKKEADERTKAAQAI